MLKEDIAPLSEEETKWYFEQLKKGDLTARDTLICHNINLVYALINRRYKNVPNKDELFSAGCLGLIDAVDHFDLSFGTKFSTYFEFRARREINKYITSQMKDKSLPWSQFIIDTFEEEMDCSLENFFLDKSTNVMEEVEKSEEYKLLHCMVSLLPTRTQEMIMLYFGLGKEGPFTEKEIASRYSISHTRVQQIIADGTKKIHQYMEEMPNIYQLMSRKKRKSEFFRQPLKILESLPDVDKEFFILFLEGATIAELAKHFSKSNDYIYSTIQKIKESLIMQEQEEQLADLLELRNQNKQLKILKK